MEIKITSTEIAMNPPMNPIEVADVLLQTIIQSCRHSVDKAPEHLQMRIAEKIYDNLNDMFTAALEDFIPDKELRPDLTAEAILAMKNKILKDLESTVDVESEEPKDVK